MTSNNYYNVIGQSARDIVLTLAHRTDWQWKVKLIFNKSLS